MVAKRSISSTSSMPAKAARPWAESPEVRWPQVQEILAESASLPTACTEMLLAAIPHALCTPKEERHRFQDSVIGIISSLHMEEEQRRRAAVAALEAEAVVLAGEGEATTKAKEDAEVVEAARAKEKTSKGAEMGEATQALEAALSQVQGERALLDQAEAQVKSASDAKTEYERKVETFWPPLKSATGYFKDSRQRNRAIDAVVACLREAQIAESLAAALPFVLKTRLLEDRDKFSRRAVEHAEAALQGQVSGMAAKIEELQAVVATKTKCVETSEQGVREAESHVDGATQACIDAENAWLDANTEVLEFGNAKSSLALQGQEIASKLEAGRVSLAALCDLTAKFNLLVEDARVDEGRCEGCAAVPAAAADGAEVVPESEACQQ